MDKLPEELRGATILDVWGWEKGKEDVDIETDKGTFSLRGGYTTEPDAYGDYSRAWWPIARVTGGADLVGSTVLGVSMDRSVVTIHTSSGDHTAWWAGGEVTLDNWRDTPRPE